ncbi:DUF4097 family beta strand repeat-containing protein [Cytobacillus solani]|uniref:DUF4097 domain-containing protein n=1 Tax=Cytobacillus solani TaxID=1637975 RepID=A0A0Q3VJ79_9BACI|nr:DUF4097 family beta strand repeat-containing protein [Cytobacillus solani]KOP79976.1 hypothetical protein AMS60_16695 [Bacillus sp. FJAT-21945]KQL21138.1 hypothetical protein AN957_22910 [Cytobacillus solani]USK54440.1 DUF4097 domain-containing protein [Cytobacillus solani]
MKRIFLIFIILIGLYVLLTSNIRSWLPFAKDETTSATADNIKMVEINLSSVKATIIPEKRNDIKADLDGKGAVDVKRNGDKIKVEYSRKWFDGFKIFNHTPELYIYIPEDFNRNMAIDVGSGYLNFEGPSTELEQLRINMSSGKVDLTNVSTKEFIHKGSSGMIDIDTLITDSGRIDMSSGKIKIDNYQGELEAEVTSGQLDVQLNKLVNDIQLRASSGQIKLDLPDDANFKLNGEMSSGYIDCDLPLTDKVVEKNKIEGMIGSGKHSIDVNITSGMVKIY